MNGQETIPLAEINNILKVPKITTAPIKWKIAIRGGFIHPLSKGDPAQGMLELR